MIIFAEVIGVAGGEEGEGAQGAMAYRLIGQLKKKQKGGEEK